MRDDKQSDINVKKWEKKNGVKMDENAWSDHPTSLKKNSTKKVSAQSDKPAAKTDTKKTSTKKIVTTKR